MPLTRIRTQFILHETRSDPILCPVMNLLALAFADDAFECLRSPQDLMILKVPAQRQSLELKWKDVMLDEFVFRASDPNQVITSKPLSYNSYRYNLREAGVKAGFPDNLTPYALRRGGANAIEGNVFCPQADF